MVRALRPRGGLNRGRRRGNARFAGDDFRVTARESAGIRRRAPPCAASRAVREDSEDSTLPTPPTLETSRQSSAWKWAPAASRSSGARFESRGTLQRADDGRGAPPRGRGRGVDPREGSEGARAAAEGGRVRRRGRCRGRQRRARRGVVRETTASGGAAQADGGVFRARRGAQARDALAARVAESRAAAPRRGVHGEQHVLRARFRAPPPARHVRRTQVRSGPSDLGTTPRSLERKKKSPSPALPSNARRTSNVTLSDAHTPSSHGKKTNTHITARP
jgi:hypothetical protein